MDRYKVRVWISDIRVDAESPLQATEKACEMVNDVLSFANAEYAEVQQKLIDGEWKYE